MRYRDRWSSLVLPEYLLEELVCLSYDGLNTAIKGRPFAAVVDGDHVLFSTNGFKPFIQKRFLLVAVAS